MIFDFFEDLKKMPKWEIDLMCKYSVNITKLQKEGKTQKEIDEIIFGNGEKFRKEILEMEEKMKQEKEKQLI